MFPDRLKDLRKQKKLTQGDLAELMGMSQATVASWEKGTRKPDIDALLQLAGILGCSVDYLLGRASADLNDTDDAWEVRERLRRDPNFRILFDASKKATAENLRAAAAMLKALEPPEYDE